MTVLSLTPMNQRVELYVYLLGPMRVERDSVPIHLPRRKVESLLAYLILHPEQHERDHLATLFWGDSTDTMARQSLRTALAIMRQVISPELLHTDRDHVQINPAFPLWVDLYQLLGLEKKLDHANGHFLHAELALWQGDLLAGFFDEWITIEREYYRTRLLKLFLQVIQHLRAHSEYSQAIDVAQRVVALDPANEHAHQHLMFCHVASGDRPAALRQYEICVRSLQDDVDAPPLPETTALYQWIKQYDSKEVSPAGRITNLPIPLTSFIGRRRETAEVKRLLCPVYPYQSHLDDESQRILRLLTLIGAGGSGKTRLAIQVATDLIDSFAYGVWWVELAALSDDALVARAVAKALGVKEANDQEISQSVADFVGGKQLLLVIDNCEHLIEPCARLAATLLERCPNLQILATSREPLNIAGERLWQVPALAVPEVANSTLVDLLLQFEGIRLFIERAAAVQPDFTLTLDNAKAVMEICQRLDGIPLAIELAAARVKVLAVEQIASFLTSALGARFHLLTQSNRVVLPRHQTLRATIDWSYDLLDEGERTLFRRLAIFRGSFTLEALEQIMALALKDSLPSISNTLDLLTQLVDKSLVIVVRHNGQNRYRLLETLREYAAEQLRVEGSERVWHTSHAAWYLDLAKRAAPELEGTEQSYWFDRLESEHDNLRAALDWYAATPGGAESGLQLSCAIARFWCTRSYLSEGQRWLETFLRQINAETAQPAQVDAMNFQGRLSILQRNFQAARAHYEQGLALGREIEYDEGVETGLIGLGVALWELGDFQKARASLEEAVAYARSVQHLQTLAGALNNLGLVCMNQGDNAATRAHLNECLVIHQQIGDQAGIAIVLFNLAMLAGHDGDFIRARRLYEEAQAIDRGLGNRTAIADALNNMGGLAVHQGDLVEAAAHFQEAEQIYREIGSVGDTAYTSTGMGDIAFYNGDYDAARARYTEALALFREASNQRLIGRVLGQLGRIACRQGNLVAAATLCGEALIIRRASGHKPGMVFVLDQGFLELAVASGQPALGARILGAVASARQVIKRPRDPIETRALEPLLASLRGQLGDTALAAIWAEGEVMSLEQVAEQTLNTLSAATAARARVYGDEAINMLGEVGDKGHSSFALCNLGDVARRFGENSQALAYYRQYLQAMHQLGYNRATIYVLEEIAILLTEIKQHPESALRLLGAADRLRQERGIAAAPYQQANHDFVLAALRQQLGDLRFEALWQNRRTIPLAQIVGEVMTISLDAALDASFGGVT